jgi:DNA-binding XRE family transcriptional regulator
MARKKITADAVAKLKSGRITDTETRGFIARRLPSGRVQFAYQYTDRISGQRGWIKIGLLGDVTVEEARRLATKYAGQVADQRDPGNELKTARARYENTVRKKPQARVALGPLIRQHREARGISLTALAKEVGKSKGMILQIENGRSAASLETLEDIAESFGLAHVGMLFEPPVPKGWRRITSIIPDSTLR